MSAIESNPPIPQESKSAKKKKAKAEAAAKDNAPQPSVDSDSAKPNAETTTDGSYESPYMKELYKSIRNVKKKLNATQRVDSIVAENPDQTLDQLLAARKINPDQKAQAQKKPSLQASLAQLEEQVAQYKQFDEDYQKRLATEKVALETSHKDELEKVKEAAIAEAKAESAKEAKDNLLVLSKFLRAAAAKRQGGDETSPENRAFEGALLLVYGGEAGAVAAMESLIAGSDEKVPTVDQVPSDYTYKQVRDLAFEYAPYAAEEAWAEDVAQSEPAPPAAEESTNEVITDPTVANAGMTELDSAAEPASNGVAHHVDTPSVPDASNIDAGAANAAGADPGWEAKLSESTQSGPDGWVEVARDPAETETALRAGLKMSLPKINPLPIPQVQPVLPTVALMGSTRFVAAVAGLMDSADAGVANTVVEEVIEGEKADIADVAAIEVIAVEEKEGIVGVVEVGVAAAKVHDGGKKASQPRGRAEIDLQAQECCEKEHRGYLPAQRRC
ncbi:MAG: hypothetical protein L6R42_002897 [Xanthoria sp. 1 TBL-2021]|nr:MAG: hypothetical protein L6R42_002897 [Xanthoria sp. 1 TBL-2021]